MQNAMFSTSDMSASGIARVYYTQRDRKYGYLGYTSNLATVDDKDL